MASASKGTADFLYEMGQLKRVTRSGWWIAGIKNPESVAEHSWRAAVIGYVLARKAGVNAERVALMCLFHDMPEARLNDAHKIQARYVELREAEEKVLKEQAALLSPQIGNEIKGLVSEYEGDKTRLAKLAKDADLLECALQAREYEGCGFSAAADWARRAGEQLATKEAKELFREIMAASPENWWRGLKKLPLKRGMGED